MGRVYGPWFSAFRFNVFLSVERGGRTHAISYACGLFSELGLLFPGSRATASMTFVSTQTVKRTLILCELPAKMHKCMLKYDLFDCKAIDCVCFAGLFWRVSGGGACVCVCTYVCIYIYIYIYMYVCIYVYVCQLAFSSYLPSTLSHS